jgi:hypothetical protein
MMPRISFTIPDVQARNVMISSIGQFEKYTGRRLYGSYHMNFFNSLTIPRLFQYTLSAELSKDDVKDVASHYQEKLEMMVFGRIELMVSVDPTLGE